MTQYTVIKNTETNGWCLHCLIWVGATEQEANKVLNEQRQANPNLELKLNLITDAENCWWNKYGTN